MEQTLSISQAEALDIAFQAVRLYAETHPRPSHVTQVQAAQMLRVSRPTVRKLIGSGVMSLNECGLIPMPDIDLIIASRTRRQLYEAPKPPEAPQRTR